MMGLLKRLVGPRAVERRRVAKLAKQSRPLAYRNARDLAGAVGPDAIAEEYEAPPGSSPEEIAQVYARACYHDETWKVARDGALDGFSDFGAR